MLTITVYDKNGKKLEALKLDETVFDGKVNKPLLHQAITMYLANQRLGSAKVKDRAEVRGGGKKPWRQKGTGRARAGSIRSPLWRGGGITFGPQPKDWHYQLPKKIKKKALVSSLNAKLNEKNIIVIDELKLDSHKTKELYGILKKLKLTASKTAIISKSSTDNIRKAAGNIYRAELIRPEDLNAYQVIVNEKILIERDALKGIEKDLAHSVLLSKTKRKVTAKVA